MTLVDHGHGRLAEGYDDTQGINCYYSMVTLQCQLVLDSKDTALLVPTDTTQVITIAYVTVYCIHKNYILNGKAKINTRHGHTNTHVHKHTHMRTHTDTHAHAHVYVHTHTLGMRRQLYRHNLRHNRHVKASSIMLP